MPQLDSPATATPARVRLAAMTGVTCALTAAVMLAPSRLAGATAAQRDHLSSTARDAVGEYWFSGGARFPSQLQSLVDYWARFHVVKGLLGALLLVSAMTLVIVAARAAGGRPPGRARVPMALLSAGGVAVALFALLVVMATIQGAAAPFSSVLSLLPIGHDARLTPVTDQIVPAMRTSSSTGDAPPALRVMLDDFARYHRVMVGVAGCVALVCAVAAAVMWRAGRRVSYRPHVVSIRVFAVLLVVVAVAAGVVAFGNVTVAADPGPALLGFFTP